MAATALRGTGIREAVRGSPARQGRDGERKDEPEPGILRLPSRRLPGAGHVEPGTRASPAGSPDGAPE